MNDPGVSGPSVLQVLPKLDADGATTSAIDVARALIEAGGKALIASEPGGGFVDEFRQAGGIHIEVPVLSRWPWQKIKVPGLVAQAAKSHGVDVIHGYGRRGSAIACKAASKAGACFVASPIGSEELPPAEWITKEIAQAELVIAASPFVASLVQASAGAVPAIETVSRGIDMVRFNPAAVSAERLIRQAQEWRADDLSSVMLVPARLSRGKGHDVLIKAMAQMTHRDVSCLIVAREADNPAYREELAAMIDEMGLEGRVRFVDHAPDMPVAYMMADVVVTPSRVPEAFNSVAAEAQAMGRPVVATKIGSTADIVLESETGWLVEPDDPAALAAALDKALGLEEHTRSILALKARTFIDRNFALPLMQDRMLTLYRSLAGRTPVQVAPAAA